METQDINSICRLCLSDTVYLYVLDENYSTLPQKIYDCVQVEVRETDRISKMICRQCLQRIEDWNVFKKICDEVQNKFQSWVTDTGPPPEIQTIIIKTEVIDRDETEPEEMPIVNQPIKVEMIGNIHDNGEDSINSLLVPTRECPVGSHSAEPLPERCRVCRKMFSSVYNRMRHERDLHDIPSHMGRPIQMTQQTLVTNQDDNTADGYCSDASLDSQTSQITQTTTYSQGSQAGMRVRRKIYALPRTEKEFVSYYTKMCHMIKNQICLYCNTHYETFKSLSGHLRKYHMKIEVFTCYFCWLSFPNLSQYRKHTHMKLKCKARAVLLSEDPLPFKPYQNFKCNYCTMLFASDQMIQEHLPSHIPDSLPIECSVCCKLLQDLDEFNQHLQTSCIYRIYCGICKFDFPSMVEFNEHTVGHDVDYPDGDTTVIKINNAEDTPTIITERPVMHNINKFDCQLCEHKFITNIGLLKHLREYHKDPSVYICKLCPKSSDTRFILYAKLSEHLRTAHKDNLLNNFSCSTCGKLFSNQSEWDEHQKTHASLECDECGEIFDCTSKLSKHKSEKHTNLKLKLYRVSDSNSYVTSTPKFNTIIPPFNCELCDKYFKTKKDLQDHEKLHDNITRMEEDNHVIEAGEESKGAFTCSLCFKDFSYRGGLIAHKKSVHGTSKKSIKKTKSKKYRFNSKGPVRGKTRKCQLCNLVFKSYKMFYKHNKLLHPHMVKTREKQMTEEDNSTTNSDDLVVRKFVKTCKQCGMKFNNASDFYKHYKTHADDKIKNNVKIEPKVKVDTEQTIVERKEFRCVSCKLLCNDLESLQQHIITVHPTPVPEGVKKLFPCIECNKICTSLAALVSHSKYHEYNKNKYIKTCDSCGGQFKGPAALIAHLRSNNCHMAVKSKTNFPCKFCNRKFSSQKSVSAHQKVHVTTRHAKDINNVVDDNVKKNEVIELSCQECKIKFSDIESFEKHVADHKSNSIKSSSQKKKLGKFHCEPCNINFATFNSYNSHRGWHKRNNKINTPIKDVIKTEDNQKILVCDICNTEFNSTYCYYQHVRTHGKTYECKHCNNFYVTIGRYKKHLKLVHDILYNEEEYGPVNDNEENLLNGLTIKTEKRKSLVNEKNYLCTECNEYFSNAKALRLHIMTHTNTTV